jgi:hypothetical protein
MTAVVFLGPTLSRRDAEAVLPARYLPPVQQGDVYRLVRDEAPRAIGIIDGVFLHVASVWHREILWALSHGVHVFGAASMGALRAAELAPFGMRGVGRIAQAYRDAVWPGYDTAFEDDDEVAVIHAPVEAGGMALSDAMVDLRDTLLAAETAGVIDHAQRDALTEAMKRLHFRERSFARLAELAVDTALPAWLPDNIVRRKRLDALEMLQAMAQFLAGDPAPFRPEFRFERALVWQQFVAEADVPDHSETLVLNELRLDPKAWHEVCRAALGRLHPTQSVDAAAERRQVERFRQQRGLWRRADLDAWLEANALDVARLERLLRHEASLDYLVAQGGAALRAAMLDYLRLTNRFASLWQNVNAKVVALADAPLPPAEPHRTAVLDWYFEQHLGMRQPAALATFIADIGWESEDDFVLAVWREYLFNKTSK